MSERIKCFVAIPTMGQVADCLPHRLREWEDRYGDKIQFVYPEHVVRRMFHDFARNELCKEFLASGCDVMWFIDSDVVPPPDAPKLLTEHYDKWEMAGCPYPVWMTQKTSSGDLPMVVYTVYRHVEGKGMSPGDVPKEGTDFVEGMATGCLLIKRSVLEKLEMPYFAFQYNETTRDLTLGEDLGFTHKLVKLGIKTFTDYSLVCQHFKHIDLLSINNYAIAYANSSVLAYDAQIKEQVQAAIKAAYQTGKQAGEAEARKSRLILPQSLK